MDNYLGYEILVCCEDWIIVYDGKYNYMLFKPFKNGHMIHQFNNGRLPFNDGIYPNVPEKNYNGRGTKEIEYYSNLDNAIYGLARVINNGGEFE